MASSSTAARTNEEMRTDTMAALVRQARSSFASRGYDRTSVEAVAVGAGLSKGAVYYHFDDKRGLFEAVFRDAQAELVGRINARAQEAADPETAVLDGCMTFVDIALDEGLRRIVLVDGPTVLGWGCWRAIDREFGLGSLHEGLRACERMGARFVEPVETVAHLLSGAMNEAVFLIAEADDGERLRRQVVTLLTAMLESAIDRS